MAASSPQSPVPRKLRRKTDLWEGLLITLLGVIFFTVLAANLFEHARTHDFLGFYSAGLLARTDPAHLYDPAVESQIQHQLVPDVDIVTAWPRPGFYTLLFIPLSYMPLTTAFLVWLALGTGAAFAIVYWAYRQFGPEALVYCSFFVPLGLGIAHGQDNAFVAGIMIMAYCAARSGRKVVCGILLAVLLGKFHFFLMMPLVLVLRREWRILLGYVPAAIVAIAISLAVASPASYLALLTNHDLAALYPMPEMMTNINSIAVNFGLDYPLVKILLSLGVVAAVVLIPRAAEFDRWFWATVAGGLLLPPHTFEYDIALLIVPILKILANHQAARSIRWIAATAVIPLPYFATLASKPFSAIPSLLVGLLFLAIAWPEWFGARIENEAPASNQVLEGQTA